MDFGSITSGKSSMRRKQSSSILGTFGRSSSSRASAIPFNTAPTPSASSTAQPPPSAYTATYPTPPTSTSSHFPDQSVLDFSPDYTDTSSGRTPSTVFSHGHGSASGHGHGLGHSASRSVSGGTIGAPSSLGSGEKGEKKVLIRRPEDVFHLTRERLFSWSYMMQWYQGDIHWFNTIKVSRQALEASLGPAKVDTRARNLYLLGMSMSPLFDISSASDFVRALLKLLDDWEAAIVEGGKGVKTLFNKRSQKKSTSVLPPELSANVSDPDSHLINLTAPFPLDFFQCHATFCSIVRDLYKKFLGMVLPRDPATGSASRSLHPSPSTDLADPSSLIHASTVIHSAPVESGANPLSPVSTLSNSTDARHGGQVTGGTVEAVQDPMELKPKPRVEQYDAFQALVAGQLPPDRMLVGDGQRLTPGLVEMFIKADARLKKHFSSLIREGDALAKKVLEDEFNKLATSLHTGLPLDFDIQNAYSVGGSHGQGPVTATGSTFRDHEG